MVDCLARCETTGRIWAVRMDKARTCRPDTTIRSFQLLENCVQIALHNGGTRGNEFTGCAGSAQRSTGLDIFVARVRVVSHHTGRHILAVLALMAAESRDTAIIGPPSSVNL